MLTHQLLEGSGLINALFGLLLVNLNFFDDLAIIISSFNHFALGLDLTYNNLLIALRICVSNCKCEFNEDDCYQYKRGYLLLERELTIALLVF